MPDFLKPIIFFLTAPIIVALMFFIVNFYGNDTGGGGWYQKLWDGNVLQWLLAVILAPIFLPARAFMDFVYPMWEELVK